MTARYIQILSIYFLVVVIWLWLNRKGEGGGGNKILSLKN
jgi:hypothetical protein